VRPSWPHDGDKIPPRPRFIGAGSRRYRFYGVEKVCGVGLGVERIVG